LTHFAHSGTTPQEGVFMFASLHSELSLTTIQLIRKAVLLVIAVGGIFLTVLVSSRWPDGGFAHEGIEFVGFCLIVFCIVGRTWCSFYIGGLKNKSLIDVGPYSVSRNPLYFFSIIGAVGIGAQLGSVVIGLLAGVVTWAVFYVLVFSEERSLRAQFGETYREYLVRVPRFFPKLSLWRDVETLSIRPGIVRATFLDACIFLVSIPFAESFDYLHGIGIVPVLFQVP
jgi:protein-S-isoprenylcysteine O-methyltransferase Ste14